MTSLKILKKKKFAIYGLGITGFSVINFFNKNNIKNYIAWDDNSSKKKFLKKKIKLKQFSDSLKIVDYIVISPGIDYKNVKISKHLNKFKKKIITDLDLFYLIYPKTKTIVVTGTNGKSTTCKIIKHLLKKNNFNVKMGGNIGNPLLNIKVDKNSILVIEASSFQLEYSNFIRPTFAIFLNLTPDHLDWHKSLKNYIKAKLKIFKNQNNKNYAIIGNNNLIKKFKQNNFKSKLRIIKEDIFLKYKTKVKNNYLTSSSNLKNLSYVYEISKILKINRNSFFKSLNDFKGLPHRNELFLKKNNVKFINDSKATSFESSISAIESNKNIYWILGGQPKKGDSFNLKKIKNNIIKSYIIGNHSDFFKNQLKNKISFEIKKNLKKALISALKDVKNKFNRPVTILLSPAAASYDQYKDFNERGNEFKRLAKFYANKYF